MEDPFPRHQCPGYLRAMFGVSLHVLPFAGAQSFGRRSAICLMLAILSTQKAHNPFRMLGRCRLWSVKFLHMVYLHASWPLLPPWYAAACLHSALHSLQPLCTEWQSTGQGWVSQLLIAASGKQVVATRLHRLHPLSIRRIMAIAV